MIAILAAMDIELEALKALMSDITYKSIKSVEVIFGKLDGHDVILAKSGVGKVEAAIRTVIILEEFDVELLIDIGSSGSLKEEIGVGSVIIPSVLAYHDLDVPDWPKDFQDLRHVFHPDSRLLRIAERLGGDDCHILPHVTGDAFIYRQDQWEKILKEYPSAASVEMEATAIANAATILDVPFIIIRAISDVVIKEGSEVVYDEFLQHAAERSAIFCKRFIKEFKYEYCK